MPLSKCGYKVTENISIIHGVNHHNPGTFYNFVWHLRQN